VVTAIVPVGPASVYSVPIRLLMHDPTTPLDAYKAIIDQIVNETLRLGAGPHVADRGIFSNAPAHREFNDFIGSLNGPQRELLARMLREERDGAIHDVLAALTWWITSRDVGLTFRGDPMPLDLSGMGLHGDYVGRREGWDWPSGEGTGGS
jgi:hypothetical protein